MLAARGGAGERCIGGDQRVMERQRQSTLVNPSPFNISTLKPDPAGTPGDQTLGDQSFRNADPRQRWQEMTYAGALSFLRRPYSRELAGVDVAVCGIPFDGATSNRPGTRLGPRAIRAASAELGSSDSFPFGGNPFAHFATVDYGDFYIEPQFPDRVARAITEQARGVLCSGAKMLSLGGDHFVSYPLLVAHAERHGPLALIQFDAHCDTWSDDGRRLDHGTMFLRAAREGIIDTERSIHVGIRSHNDETHGFKVLTSPWIHRHGVDAAIAEIIQRVGPGKAYLSFDIDVLDPAFAPGTGTPVAGGLHSWQALEIVRSLEGLDIAGADVVEVSPPYDHAEITALAGATVAHDILCVWANSKRRSMNS
jgi:agmatinase